MTDFYCDWGTYENFHCSIKPPGPAWPQSHPTLSNDKSHLRTPTSDLDEESIQESFVLVLVTGGTLCMMKNESGNYAPVANYLTETIPQISLLHDHAYYTEHLASRIKNTSTFVLPE